MRISRETSEQVRNVADIVDVIGEFVRLKKKGSNYFGPCPFHSEKTASFSVSPERGIYKCFGCGKSGNVINFVMEYHTLNFPEAVRMLALKFSIPIIDSDERTQKVDDKRELVLMALNAASEFFTNLLFSETGKNALQYLRNRHFSDEMIKKFNVGYSADSWDMLYKYLKKKSFEEDTLEQAGLIKRGDKGYFDMFRGRVMFSIKDNLGRIVAFGARRMNDDDSQPKYINSSQSIVYDKSRTLYALFEAKNSIRNLNYSIMVEGYADALTLHQAGISNVVASSGTSLTNEQLQLLGRYSKKLYIVYDGDQAGLKATERGIDIAISQGYELFIVRLPEKEDPDSFVREHGKEEFDQYIKKGQNFLEFLIQIYRTRGDFGSPSYKSEIARSLLKLISKIPDKLQHDDYFRIIASHLNLSENQLITLYKEKEVSNNAAAVKASEENITKKELSNDSLNFQEIQFIYSPKSTIDSLLPEEKLIIILALESKNNINILFDKYNFSKNLLITSAAHKLFSLIVELSEENTDINRALTEDEAIDPVLKESLILLSMLDEKQSDKWENFGAMPNENKSATIIKDCVFKLELKALEFERKRLTALLKTNSIDTKITKQIIQIDERRSQINDELIGNDSF
ncbi:MAG: DNA primase [Candidatus Kapabacteria bacterium]|nr:DNA primase [Candidatus Kapabacteria bacterium]